MNLDEYREIRESFGGTNLKFAQALNLSYATVYKFEHDSLASAALRLKYADRLRALAGAIAADSALQAPEITPDGDNEEALRLYNQITRAATALYRLAKTASVSAQRSSSARQAHAMSVEEIGRRQVAIADERKRVRGIQARNQARAEQRPMIALLVADLAAALNRSDAAAYHDILRNPPQRKYALVFVDAFVAEAATRLVAADDPLVTLPDETA